MEVTNINQLIPFLTNGLSISVNIGEEIGWLDMNVRGINLWENCVYCNDAEWARTPQWFFLKRTKIKI